ncbi:N-acetyltransferase [uncultured Sphingomonas sp.]|uniref:GNAT family N-acetyltransferase n=1 Tax=uncultured Sphingomonas sp. TaxID=158754 RepID=UPI0025D772AF|nr:N-acetyltransferase [uncultured Sphingomonas sp.]
MILITPLAHVDPLAVEQLLDTAFGADRHGRTAYRIRSGMAAVPDLSFAAMDGEAFVGSLQSWPIALHGAEGATPLVLVGPVAVAPGHQGRGIGQALMRRMLEAAAGGDPLVLIGDPEYYGRFGFDDSRTAGWEAPGPVERRRLLASSNSPLPRDGMLGPRA